MRNIMTRESFNADLFSAPLSSKPTYHTLDFFWPADVDVVITFTLMCTQNNKNEKIQVLLN